MIEYRACRCGDQGRFFRVGVVGECEAGAILKAECQACGQSVVAISFAFLTFHEISFAWNDANAPRGRDSGIESAMAKP